MELALQHQYKYYIEHEDDLLRMYQGKYLVISDDMQITPFASPKDAYRYGVNNFGAGHFMLHKCTPGSLNVVHQVNCAF